MYSALRRGCRCRDICLSRPSLCNTGSRSTQYIQYVYYSSSGIALSEEPVRKGMLQSFFQGLQKMGVGRQFELEKEKMLWGREITGSSCISSIMANKQKGGSVGGNATPTLIQEWKIFSDAEYGGGSVCEVVVNPRTSVVSFSGRVAGGNDEEKQQAGTNVSEVSAEKVNPLSRRTSTSPSGSPTRAAESAGPGGYCAMTGYCRSPVDLINFEGVELMIRTSKPTSFLFSLKPVSLIEDDLYQVILQTSNNSWKRFHLPFHLFTLTARGQLAMEQRKLDNLKLKSVGVLLTQPGEHFRVEIQSLKAVTEMDDDVLTRTVRSKVVLTDEEMDELYPTDDMSKVFTRTTEAEQKED